MTDKSLASSSSELETVRQPLRCGICSNPNPPLWRTSSDGICCEGCRAANNWPIGSMACTCMPAEAAPKPAESPDPDNAQSMSTEDLIEWLAQIAHDGKKNWGWIRAELMRRATSSPELPRQTLDLKRANSALVKLNNYAVAHGSVIDASWVVKVIEEVREALLSSG